MSDNLRCDEHPYKNRKGVENLTKKRDRRREKRGDWSQEGWGEYESDDYYC